MKVDLQYIESPLIDRGKAVFLVILTIRLSKIYIEIADEKEKLRSLKINSNIFEIGDGAVDDKSIDMKL